MLSTIDFVKEINALRLASKNSWYVWQGTVNNQAVIIKGYKTWLQVFTVNGLRVATVSDISVKEFKDTLSSNV